MHLCCWWFVTQNQTLSPRFNRPLIIIYSNSRAESDAPSTPQWMILVFLQMTLKKKITFTSKFVCYFEMLALPLIHPFIILPIFLLSIWQSFLSLAPSFPLNQPSSWRLPCSLSHPSVSIH